VYDGVPLFDRSARRWLLAATCGGKGAALLAVSASEDARGAWLLSNVNADAAGTGLACTAPQEAAVADAVRVSYDAHGVYLSL
jgi:hypothetical protein